MPMAARGATRPSPCISAANLRSIQRDPSNSALFPRRWLREAEQRAGAARRGCRARSVLSSRHRDAQLAWREHRGAWRQARRRDDRWRERESRDLDGRPGARGKSQIEKEADALAKDNKVAELQKLIGESSETLDEGTRTVTTELNVAEAWLVTAEEKKAEMAMAVQSPAPSADPIDRDDATGSAH
jgi:hypothetical protein